METSDRFERVESIRGPTPLQDGRNHSDEGFGTEGQLDGETRHEGCLLISPHIPSTSKIPQVPMAREDLGIQESSLRTTECPSCVHKASKTNCCIVEEAGHKMYFISGRHAQSRVDLQSQLATAIELLILLEFIINTKKGVFKPTQVIEFLGFRIDSQQMSMALPKQKLDNIKKGVRKLKEEKEVATRQIARVRWPHIQLFFRHPFTTDAYNKRKSEQFVIRDTIHGPT